MKLDIHMKKRKKKNLDLYLILYSKVHLSWIIDLGIKAKIIKLLGEHLHHLSVGKNFLEHKTDKLDYRKLRLSFIKISLTKRRVKPHTART